MKRLLLIPLLVSISLINSGFIFNKGEVKGVVCGDSEFFTTLKKDFLLKNIYKQAFDINILEGRLRIFNFKTGKSYTYSNFYESLIPSQDIESSMKGVPTTLKPIGISKRNNIILKILAYQNGKLKTDYDYEEILNLKDMTLKSEYEGEKILDMTCEYIPIPKNIKIKNK